MTGEANSTNGKNHEIKEEYLARIQQKYNIMSEAERRIADFILINGHENNLKYNINDFAGRLKVSPATIVRFCRTLGFSGFSEFRYYMQMGILSPIGSNTQVTADDNINALTQKVASLLSRTTYYAAEIVDKNALNAAIDMISKADTVYFTGIGSAHGLAITSAAVFQNIGIKSLYLGDELIELRFANRLTEKDVLIGMTNCGSVKTVIDTMEVAQSAGAKTICITGMADSLITKYSDIVLTSSMGDYQNVTDQCAIIMAQMTIINALQMGCAVRITEESKRYMMSGINLINMKRYDLGVEAIERERVTTVHQHKQKRSGKKPADHEKKEGKS